MRNQSIRKLTPYRQSVLLFIALSTFLAVFGVQGIEYGVVNNFRDQSVQIPIINSYANPNEFIDDTLVEARDSYVTLFYPAIGLLARVFPLSELLQTLYILSTAITLGGVYMLGETLFRERRVGPYAVILWMVYFSNPGGDFIHSPFITHTTFAIAIELWALVFIFRGRYSLAASLLGIAVNINAMTAFFVTFMWFVAVLLNPKVWSWRLLHLPFLMAGMALPTLYWKFSLPLTEASLDQFIEIMRMRLWYVVFPSTIQPILWVGFAALLLLWRYSWRFGLPESEKHRMVLSMVAGIAGLCVVATFFAEVVPLEFIIELQLIRSTWLITVMMMFYYANMFGQLIQSDKRWQHWLAFGLILALTCPRWVLELAPPNQPTPYPLIVDLDTPWVNNHRLLVGIILTLVLGGLFVVVRYLVQHRKELNLSTQGHMAAAWFTVAAFSLAWPAVVDSKIPDEQKHMTDDWQQTLIWIRDNTPETAMFVTPPEYDGFRMETKRAYLGDWKDGTIGIFHNGWAIDWYTRMEALGFNDEDFIFEPMTQDRLCTVVRDYDVDYAVVKQEWKISGEPVYTNDQFAVIPTPQLVCE
ncbi:MAG: hypothetical protein HY866_18360 [Chloroflexi bacterium]|nr:hypothetical protein [Chloroflexota bacterium]